MNGEKIHCLVFLQRQSTAFLVLVLTLVFLLFFLFSETLCRFWSRARLFFIVLFECVNGRSVYVTASKKIIFVFYFCSSPSIEYNKDSPY